MTWDTARFVSLDFETYLIEPGILAPRIVCGSIAANDGSRLLYREAAIIEAGNMCRNPDRIIVGANVAYDFGCLAAADPDLLPLIFKAYAEGRVYDIQIAQALHAIAEGNLYQDPLTGSPMKGRYSLDTCVRYVLGREDAKINDYWRLRYALLEDVPIDEWPEEAKQYPIDDAVNTLEVAVAQVDGGGAGITPGPHRNLGDLSNQVETAFALHLGAIWGLRTDPDRVEALRRRTEEAHASFVERFRKLGFFKADGKEDTTAVKRAVVRAYGGGGKCQACISGKILSPKTGNPIKCKACSGTGLDIGPTPTTPTGGVSADRDTLMESGDEDLIAYGASEAEKVRDTYLPKLESETVGRQLRPNVLVSSLRVSYDGVIQLLPRTGDVRGCFKARPGYVFCSVDYAALELCTLAQVCLWILGRSQMAETINATGDPGSLHTAFAASMAGKTAPEMAALIKAKDENAKRYRQAAKAANFGFPGGMGSARFVLAKRKKSEGTTTAPDGTVYPGIRFCLLLGGAERCGLERVTEWKGKPTPPICRACASVVEDFLRPAWFEQWPEIRDYFNWVSQRVEFGGEVPFFGTDCVRGGVDFTNGANNGFQSLAAMGAKNAERKVTRECYGVGPLGRESPLYGTRIPFFVHDELFAEMPEEWAHLAGPRMAEVMIAAMREWVPDVCIVAEPALMRWWDKNAEPVYRYGRLIPWEDREQVKEAA